MGSAWTPQTSQLVASNIKGSTTGVAPAAGYLGEVIEASDTSVINGSVTAGVVTDIVSITLQPGCWTINATAILYAKEGSGTGENGRLLQLLLTDNSNNLLRSTLCGFVAVGCTPVMNQGTVVYPVNIAVATTYKMRFTSIENGAGTTIGGLFSIGYAGRPSIITATRRA